MEVLGVVRALLEHGLLAGNLTKEGGFEPWDRQDSQTVINRIRREWRNLGRDPTIDEIAWFQLPR